MGFEFFDAIYCINRIDQTQRWCDCLREFGRFNIDVTRWPVRKEKDGAMGLSRTNIEILEESKDRNDENVLIFEDDAKFVGDVLDVLNYAIDELPDNWEILHLGVGLKQKPEVFSEHLVQLTRAMCVHAVCYHRRVYDRVIDGWKKNKKVIDVWLADHVQNRGTCFCTNPMICVQRDSVSSLSGKEFKEEILWNKWKRKFGE